MKPPTLFQWLIGNPVVSICIMLGGLYVIYAWFTGSASGVAALIAVVLGAMAAKASERVNSYSAWKREWQGMEGRRSVFLPRGSLKVVVAICAWVALAAMAFDGSRGDPVIAAAIVMFWAGTAMMVVVGCLRLLRRSRRAPRRQMVQVCLDKPMLSPGLQDALRAVER